MALPKRNHIIRSNFIFALLLVMFVILIGRVGYWQFVRGDELRESVQKQTLRDTRVIADRGTIYDRNGKIIAQSASSNTLVCSPKDIKDAGAEKKPKKNKILRFIPIGVDMSTASPAFDNAAYVADAIAPIINVDRDELYKKMTKDNSYYQVLKRKLSLEETEKINALRDWTKYPGVEADKKSSDMSDEEWAVVLQMRKTAKAEAAKFKGLYYEEDSKRYYSYNIAPHVLGFTDNDNKGREGIEVKFDSELTGRAGSIVSAKSASGATMDFEYEERNASSKGADVILTIDETIQHFLEKHLENAVKEYQLKEGAAGIIMNPKTGEILAMSTKPDFDNNDPYNIEGYTEFVKQYDSDLPQLKSTPTSTPTASADANGDKDSQKNEKSESTSSSRDYESDEVKQAVRYRMWRNKAISDTYEPGSTFKILTAAMALEENVVNLNSPFYCSGSLKVGDRTIGCHKRAGHGSETFLQGVQNSCNPVFMELGLRLGGEKFMEYFKAFGLTEKTGINLIGESGSVFYTKKMGDVDVATSAFGQGNSVTPIQLITAISSVINGGELMKPQIVKEIRDKNGIIKSFEPEVRNRVISKETSDTMREILESVVGSPSGTGKNAYIKGYRIGGKTGTSEKGRNNSKRIASFVGFAPADDPEIICLVMLDEPQTAVKYGGTIAAPLVGSIIEETLGYLGVERQFTEEELAQMNITVPELRGMKVDEAKTALTNIKMTAKVQGDGEEVVDQLPKPGSAITENSTVILYTTAVETEDTVTVPDVTGMSISGARNTLKNAGLNFEIIGAGYNSSTEQAYAAKQSIAAGEKVAPATVIGVEFRHTSSD